MKNKQNGFTLIELMISIGLSLLISLFIMGFYFANRMTYKSIDNNHQIQYSAQFVFDSLTKDIRSAGYMGCSTASNFYNVLNTQATTETWSNLRAPIKGFGGSVFDSAMVGAKANTNAIIITSSDMERSTSIKFHSPTSTANQFLLNSNPFLANEKVVVSDCANSTIFKIDSVSASTITYNSNGNCVLVGTVPALGSSCDGVVPRAYAYSPGALINGLRVRGYFIAPSTIDVNKNSLYLIDYIKGTGKQELAENVENMVINYGIDTDGDGVVNKFVKYTDVTDWAQVVTVEIELLFKSGDQNVNITSQSYYIDNTLTTSTDKNLYRSYKTYISVRNKTS
jgi:type IV pilus assembly protein PilW